MRSDLPPAVAALVEIGAALARRAPSTQLAIARAGDLVRPADLTDAERAVYDREVVAAREATCVPLRKAEVERILRDAWDQAPGKVLDELDPEPLAVRPAAQIHRAELDGEEVVVKVRRPGVERAVRTDLSLLEALPAPLRAAFPNLDATAILRDARESALDELDFEHEASQQRRVARALRAVDGIHVPKPHLDWSSAEVLVSSYADGTTLADGGTPGVGAARTLVAAVRTVALDAGLALVDLRPTHVIVGRNDELALLGAGVARPVDSDRAQRALAALAAVADDDPDAFAVAATEAGVLDDARAREAHAMARAIAGPLVDGPALLDLDALRSLGERSQPHVGAAARLAMASAPHPQDLALGRMLGQLVAVLSWLGATEDWAALAR